MFNKTQRIIELETRVSELEAAVKRLEKAFETSREEAKKPRKISYGVGQK